MARALSSPVRISAPMQGVDGATIFTLARDPIITDGRIRDFCINTVSKHLWGPKTAAGWTDKGLIKGDAGWYPIAGVVSDGARRVHRIVDWAGGEGTKPATGQYIGATGYVTLVADAADMRGPQGPDMLIDALTAGADDVSYDTQVATADPSDDNVKQPLKNLMAASGSMTFATISAAQAVAIPARVKSVQIMTAADTLGGPAHVRQRVDAEPSGTAKHRSLDRFTSDGGTDSANGGWWELVVAPSIQATDILVPSDGTYTNSRPNVNRLVDGVILTDYVDRALWAGIRNGTPTGNITNSRGQDSLDGIISDVIASGGVVRVPEGTFRAPPKTITKWRVAIEAEKGAVWQTTSATADQIQCGGAFQDIVNLRFESTVPRVSGACVRALWQSTRVNVENIESQGAFTLFALDGHPTDPTQDRGIYTCRHPKAFDTVAGGIAYLVGGGYAAHLEGAIAISNTGLDPALWPQNSLKITRCADLKVDGNPQFIGAIQPLYVCPPTGSVVASLSLPDGYYGTSRIGSLITAALGGQIVTLDIGKAWFGENQVVSSPAGLSLVGHHTDGIVGVELTGTNFPLCQGDGFQADAHVKRLKLMGGSADGCAGAGYAFVDTVGWQAIGLDSGSGRWGGNAVGAYLSAGCEDFILSGNLKGNISSLVNGTGGTSASKIITALT